LGTPIDNRDRIAVRSAHHLVIQGNSMIRKVALSIAVLLAGVTLGAAAPSGTSTPATASGPVPAAASTQAALPAAIAPKEKIDLFNGKDFAGWAADANTLRANSWSIKDGIIVCTGRPNGYLRTDASYTQYKLTVEWRFTKSGNTGVIVHVNPPAPPPPAPDRTWPKCIECQGMHDHQGDFWIWSGAKVNEPLQQRNGVIMKSPSAEKPLGEWNTYQVVCKDDTVTIIVNGTEMNKVTGCNIKEGQIGLQSEGAGIEVRKVTIEPLTP
jgi:hypothetical protein